MRKIRPLLFIALMPVAVNFAAKAQDEKLVILITNAKIFNGTDKLVEGMDVLVEEKQDH